MHRVRSTRKGIEVLWLLLAPVAAGCGTSDGLLTDHTPCHKTDMLAATAELDAANAGIETTTLIPGSLGVQPTALHSFSVPEETNLTAIAVKLAARNGAGGNVKVELFNNATGQYGPTSTDTSMVGQTVLATDIGSTGTWLLVDFGLMSKLLPERSYWIVMTAAYAYGTLEPVAWSTTPGTGYYTYDTDPSTNVPSWRSESRAGIFALQTCD